MKKVLMWSGIVVLGLIVIGAILGESEETTTVENVNEEVDQTESKPISTEVEIEPEQEDESKSENEIEEYPEEDIEEIIEEEQNESPEPSLTLAQQNAIGAAEDYINFTAFSKQGLIEQLEYEGFSNEDATFAVNYIVVDWKEQAVKSGEDYLDFTSFSRSGLIEQLMFEGFTKEQATYAVDQIGL